MRVMIIPTRADARSSRRAGLLFVAALNSARERFWIIGTVLRARRGRDEGARSWRRCAAWMFASSRCGKGDSLPVHLAAFHYIACSCATSASGSTRTNRAFCTRRSCSVDDDISAVGTANFDNRSFRLNFEVTALIVDREFGAGNGSRCWKHDFAHASSHRSRGASSSRPFWCSTDLSRRRRA